MWLLLLFHQITARRECVRNQIIRTDACNWEIIIGRIYSSKIVRRFNVWAALLWWFRPIDFSIRFRSIQIYLSPITMLIDFIIRTNKLNKLRFAELLPPAAAILPSPRHLPCSLAHARSPSFNVCFCDWWWWRIALDFCRWWNFSIISDTYDAVAFAAAPRKWKITQNLRRIGESRIFICVADRRGGRREKLFENNVQALLARLATKFDRIVRQSSSEMSVCEHEHRP